jgi:hypothetical protein
VRTNLTPRQIEIDRMLADGINPLAICGRLRISGATLRAEYKVIESDKQALHDFPMPIREAQPHE